MGLTTVEALKSYLDSKNTKYTDVKLLTGGTANFVYRVSLIDGSSVVYKHAAPYLSSQESFVFDPTRMDYEDRAIEVLPPLLKRQLPSSAVHAPKWYSYDGAAKLLCIEDGGDRNLKDAYTDIKLDIHAIGRELGTWIAMLHLCSTKTSLALGSDDDIAANNPIGVYIYRHSYRNLHSAFEMFGHDTKLAKYVDEEYGSRLSWENECVCHGDFWTGNVLLKPSERDETEMQLTVVDWEIVRRGTSATDVAQFAAESFLADRFRGGRGLRQAFLAAYAEARDGRQQVSSADSHTMPFNREWVKRMAIHWAVHVAFWPTRVPWVDEDGQRKLVAIGIRVIKAVINEEWDTLSQSELFEGVADVYRSIWGRTTL